MLNKSLPFIESRSQTAANSEEMAVMAQRFPIVQEAYSNFDRTFMYMDAQNHQTTPNTAPVSQPAVNYSPESITQPVEATSTNNPLFTEQARLAVDRAIEYELSNE